jgi:hypothetical protein
MSGSNQQGLVLRRQDIPLYSAFLTQPTKGSPMPANSHPKFSLGTLLATPGALVVEAGE